MSSSDELQKSMVIDKSNHLSFKMLAKNFILDLLTWGLWIYSIAFIIKYAKGIFTRPILEKFFFPRCDWPYVPHCYCTCSGYIFLVDNFQR